MYYCVNRYKNENSTCISYAINQKTEDIIKLAVGRKNKETV